MVLPPVRPGRPPVVVVVCLVIFLLAAASAPHRHVNDLEDLFLDQRSDSGLLLESGEALDAPNTPAIDACSIVRDLACLACFTHDFVSSPIQVVGLARLFESLPHLSALAEPPVVDPGPRDTPSRAPPSHS